MNRIKTQNGQFRHRGKSYVTSLAACLLMSAVVTVAHADDSDIARQKSDIARQKNVIGLRSSEAAKNELSILGKIVEMYREASKSALVAGDYAIAERAARNGLAAVPGDVRLLRLQGESLIRLGLNEEALRVQKQYNDKVSDERSFARIGLLMARLGQSQRSLEMVSAGLLEHDLPPYLKGSVLKPNNPKNLELYWLLAIAVEAETYANDDESIYYYSKAQELAPNHIVANVRLGKIHMRKKNYEKAVDCFSRVTTGPKKVVKDVQQQLMIARAKASKAKIAGSAGKGG